MAAEVKIGLSAISYLKGPVAINIVPPVSPLSIDVAGENSMHDVFVLTTTDVGLSKGNITTVRFVYVKNMDVTNNVLMGIDGTSYQMKLKPGEYCLFPLGTATTLHAKSSASTVLIEYAFIEA